MKTTRILVAVALSAVITCSCDTVRSLLGKPTSAQIEAMRLERLAAEKARQDSIDFARAQADSVAAAQAALAKAHPAGRYKVIVGSFMVPENAGRMQAKLERLGMQVERLQFANGFELVSVFSSDNMKEVQRKFDALMQTDDVPYDSWIYDTEKQLHK